MAVNVFVCGPNVDFVQVHLVSRLCENLTFAIVVFTCMKWSSQIETVVLHTLYSRCVVTE